MIYITQLVYLQPGKEEIFHEFEDIVLPLIEKYRGRLLLRVRPDAESIIANTIDKPYEIHIVEFEDDACLVEYNNDELRKSCLHLKEASIKSAMFFKGIKL